MNNSQFMRYSSLNNQPHTSRQRGFTMIELTLYVSLMSIFLLSLVSFLTAFFEAREKQSIMAEVDQQGIQIMQIINDTIKKADSITLPAVGQDGVSLSLVLYDNAESPTIFNLNNSMLTVTIGTEPPVLLHNDRVSISSLAFRNISPPDSPGSLQIVLIVTSRPKPGGRTVFTYTKTFQTTISLRRP